MSKLPSEKQLRVDELLRLGLSRSDAWKRVNIELSTIPLLKTLMAGIEEQLSSSTEAALDRVGGREFLNDILESYRADLEANEKRAESLKPKPLRRLVELA